MNTLQLDSGHVRLAEHGTLLHATLARADKHNALNRTMYIDLARIVTHLTARDDLHALLLDGAGPSFCAGNDISEFASPDDSSGLDIAMDFVRALMTTDKPVVMAVHGHATGIGTTMLLHADLVIAADSARLYTAFIDLGVVPEAGSSRLLPERIGRQNAARLLLVGDTLDAAEAERMGLIAYRCSDAELADRAMQIAQAVAAKPPRAMQQTKQLLRHDTDALEAQIDREIAFFRERLQSAEAQAIFTRFLSKSK